MDKIAEVKQVVRHDNWKRMYEEYQSSGMKVNDWCVMHGVSVKTFYYRLKVICEEMLKESGQHDIVPVHRSAYKHITSCDLSKGFAESAESLLFLFTGHMKSNVSPQSSSVI